MMTVTGELLFFCLAAGAALGCLLLLFRVVRILTHAGKFLTALLDILYCCLCTLVVFLCALAVDRGRLRLLQALLQLLGGWAVVTALGPFVSGAARRLKKIFCKVSSFFRKRWGILVSHFRPKKRKPAKNRKKDGKKAKKTGKKT